MLALSQPADQTEDRNIIRTKSINQMSKMRFHFISGKGFKCPEYIDIKSLCFLQDDDCAPMHCCTEVG